MQNQGIFLGVFSDMRTYYTPGGVSGGNSVSHPLSLSSAAGDYCSRSPTVCYSWSPCQTRPSSLDLLSRSEWKTAKPPTLSFHDAEEECFYQLFPRLARHPWTPNKLFPNSSGTSMLPRRWLPVVMVTPLVADQPFPRALPHLWALFPQPPGDRSPQCPVSYTSCQPIRGPREISEGKAPMLKNACLQDINNNSRQRGAQQRRARVICILVV